MNDLSTSFNLLDARTRRRLAPGVPVRATLRCRPAPRPGASALQAQASQVQASARSELACRGAWSRVRALGPDGVLALQRAPARAAGAGQAVALPALAAIACEVEHALANGARRGSARALVLLASLACARFDGGAAAHAVAEAALVLAQSEQDAAEYHAVLRLHAALVMARHAPFGACVQAFGPAPVGAGELAPALLHAGLRLAAGAPLPGILHALEQATTASAAAPVLAERAARAAVLRVLVLPHAGTGSLPAAPCCFTGWTLRLQLAWYSGERAEACRAALAAAPLRDPLAAPADLLGYHLFAALALAWDASPRHRHALRWHCGELAQAAVLCEANAGAMAALAGAVELATEGDVPAALRGYEAAAALAERHGQTWLAALAWELAATLCEQCRFGAAMPAYRRRALMAWHACGAHGRIARLCQGWNGDNDSALEPVAPAGTDRQEESCRVARAGTVGELGVSIAHEVNQPLAAILLQAAAARRWLRRPRPDLDKALEALEQIAVSGRRAGDIVRSVQGLARRHATCLTLFPVDAALEEALRLLSGPLRRHGVRAELSLQLDGCQVHANRAQLQQVVINLLLNAIEALATVEGRPRDIVLASRRLGPDSIEISVADNGPGVSPLDREHIFDALFSTKANGTGVGLSISRSIAEAHGGYLAFRPRTPHGALFALVLAAGADAVDAGNPD
jgi:signal transduction histidine kinase